VTTRPRIGELLLAHHLVDEPTLARALAEQPKARRRVCSILIASGAVHPDDAVRALAAQHEMAGALQRHLTGRDPVLASLLPAELARSWMALPIGRMRGGELIVCVRDPSRELIPELERATQGPVMLAIAPASQLEALVASAYGRVPTGELDVNFETGLIAVIDDSTFQLVDLDDDRVAKMTQQIAIEARQSPAGMPARPSERTMTPLPARTTTPPPVASPLPPRTTTPPPTQASLPPRSTVPPAPAPEPPVRPSSPPRTITPLPTRITTPPPAAPPEPPRTMTPPPIRTTTPPSPWSTVPPPTAPIALDHTLRALERAQTRDDATDVAMAFVESRFPSSLLLAVKDGAAVGHRGHGPNVSADAIQSIAVPLTAPTIVKLAHDSRRIATTTPPGAGSVQERLEQLLGDGPIAGPVFVSSRVACVLVVGADDLDALAGAELDRLTTALGVAYTRITLDAKKS
jgi:hypothetical protein